MKRSNAGSLRRVLIAVLSLSFAARAYGQLGKGAVEGSVTDPSGASVPNATVTLVNEGTGVARTVQSNAAGLYRFDFTEAGSYSLKVAAQGFANYELTKLVVTVGQTVTSDVRLELGRTAATVTVEASGVQLVNVANAELSGLVSRTTIANLPLEIRDATAFVNLQPGAVPDAFNGSTRGAAVNGMRGGMGNFMVDGTDNNDYGQGGRSHNSSGTIPGGMVSISPDAVQEFRVVTNNFSAEYGRQGGFVTDTVLKSGSNQLHGSAFEYNRNSKTTANDFFSNKVGNHDVLIRNQFGGSAGGPIRKDKMFIFGAVELQRLRQETPTTVTTVRQQFIDFVNSGQFAAFANQNAAAFGLSSPIDCSNPSNPGCSLGPIFKQLDSAHPLPRSTTPVGPTDNLSTSPLYTGVAYPVPVFGQATYAARTEVNQTRFDTRYDYQINPTNTLTAHYIFDDFPTFNGGIGGDFLNPGYGIQANSRSQNDAIAYTHIFTPTIVNELKFTYLRAHADFPRQDPQVPSIGTFDALTVGFGTTSSLPQTFTENTFQYQDNLAITRGRHSVKLGGEYRRTRNGSQFAAERDGLFEVWDAENLLTDGAIGDLGGNGGWGDAEASINPSSSTPARPEFYRGFRANEFGGYVHDNWKIRDRVTLNLGLRYDYFGPPHNFRPNLDSNFYFGPSTLNQCVVRNSNGKTYCFPTQGAANPWSTNPYYPVNPYTAAEFGGTFKLKNSDIWQKDTDNFAPRFGVAWDVRGNQKTVVRAGGGVFYDRMWNNLFENIRFNPPLFAFSQFGGFSGTVEGPISTPGFYSIPINIANFAGPGALPSGRHMDQNLKTAYSEQVNFDIQQQLAGSWLLDVAYVGTFGHKLTGVVDLNTFPGRRGFGFSSRRINPNLGSDNARGNFYNSNYSGLQTRLTKRMSRGVQLDFNYTWSHALDYVSDAFNNKAGGDYRPEDSFNRQLEYGNADFDIRHRIVGDFVWDMPFYRSNRWLGGWSFNGVVIWQSGSPFTVFDSAIDSDGDGHLNDRGTFLGKGGFGSAVHHGVSPADGYLYANLFAPPPQPTAGGVPQDGWLARNAFFGPAYFNTDLSVSKNFRINERASLKVIVSSFNIWNHPSFLMVPAQGTQQGGDISNPQFGQAPQTVQPNNTGTGGRVFQFGVRIDF